MIEIYNNFETYIHKNGMFPFIYNNTGITDDKVLHFIIGFIIAFIIYKLGIKALVNFYILVGLSIIKESMDYITGKGNPEMMDIITNLLGYSIILLFYFKENIKKLFLNKEK